MSFGQKPGAWARPGDPLVNAAQSQQINPNLFTNQLGLAAGQPFGGISLGSSLNALVNQAAFTNMNVLAQAQAAQRAQQLVPQSVSQTGRAPSPTGSRNQRTFLGTVTKLMDTYGFVDEDVFFQTSVIRGQMPHVGDRVMVEASYNPSMPFKWNAYRIQLPQQEPSPNIQAQLYQQSQQISTSASSNRWNNTSNERSRDDHTSQRQHLLSNPPTERNYRSARRSPSLRNERRSSPPAKQRSPYRKASPARKQNLSSTRSSKPEIGSKRERERTPVVRESRETTRARSPANTVVSKRDGDSPPRRRQRVNPRYHCYHPKQLISSNDLKYADIQRRYNNLYIPSDFIRCNMSWLKSIQLDEPIKLSPHPIRFSVLHKDMDVVLEEGQSLPPENPPDADSRYVVKVLLLSHSGQSATNQKVFGLLPDGSFDESLDTQSLLKNIHFLVGSRGKNEFMCIGGAWSPSLDGLNPNDPQTMINTAIRTTRALTGIDLSECPKWYEMVRIRYYRVERNRMDSVVLMLPDTNACLGLMPTVERFKELEEQSKNQLNKKLAAIDAEEFTPPSSTSPTTNGSIAKSSNSTAAPAAKSNSEGTASSGTAPSTTADQQPAATEVPVVSPTATDQINGGKKKTPWSELNVKTMKVVELRDELEARGLDSKGVKNALIQRLQEALNKEREADGVSSPTAEQQVTKHPIITIKEEIVELMETNETETTPQNVAPEAPATEVEMTEELVEKEDDAANEKELEKAKEKFEKDKKERKAALERHYVFPKEPSILVYPSKTAKGGKFECKAVSIATLLDYRLDDNKEASFEVFLFAEALRESLDRSNAFVIYQSLESALDKDAEKKRREEALLEVKEVPSSQTIENSESPEKKEKTDSSKDSKDASKDDKKPKTDPRHNFKALVNNVDVFTSFAYFDENVSGSIEDRDVEEILYTLSLDVSRGQIQKLIKKISSRDHVNYRNLTDKWVDKEGNIKYTPEPNNDAPNASELIKGVFSLLDSNSKSKTPVEPTLDSTPDVTDTGVVVYKGSVLKIGHCLEQSKTIEIQRNATLLKNEQLELNLKATKEQRDYLEKKKRRLEEDLDRYKNKFHDAEKSYKNSHEENAQLKNSLQDCKKYGERLIYIVDKAVPPPKKEEKKEEKNIKESSSQTEQISTTDGESNENAPAKDGTTPESENVPANDGTTPENVPANDGTTPGTENPALLTEPVVNESVENSQKDGTEEISEKAPSKGS